MIRENKSEARFFHRCSRRNFFFFLSRRLLSLNRTDKTFEIRRNGEKPIVLRRTDVPETREAGYQRQSDIRASKRDEENEESGRFSAVR